MSEEEFAEYEPQAIQTYAEEKVKAGNWLRSEAFQRADKEFHELLPEGVKTKDHHLFSIVDEKSETRVGLLWFEARNQERARGAFLFDFVIFERFRRRGFGAEAMGALEEKVKELGFDRVSLHVFGHNHPARSLYEKMGYTVTNINMSKRLSSSK